MHKTQLIANFVIVTLHDVQTLAQVIQCPKNITAEQGYEINSMRIPTHGPAICKTHPSTDTNSSCDIEQSVHKISKLCKHCGKSHTSSNFNLFPF